MRSNAMRENFKVGDQVYFGRQNGEKTLGTIIKMNLKTAKVRTLEDRGTRTRAGQEWGVSYQLMHLAHNTVTLNTPLFSPTIKKPIGPEDHLIMQAISNTYSALEPEFLTCDGELSFTEVQHRRRSLEARLKGLFQALGRTVLEEEAFDWAEKQNGKINA